MTTSSQKVSLNNRQRVTPRDHKSQLPVRCAPSKRGQRRRLRADRDVLAEEGWRIRCRHTARFKVIEVWRDALHLYLIASTEYPAAPPRVFAPRAGNVIQEIQKHELPSLRDWSEEHSLASVTQEASALLGVSR